MDSLTVDLRTIDIGAVAASPEACAAEMISSVVKSWDEGADVVVFPEYSWMSLAGFVNGKKELPGVAELFWETLWPGLQTTLSRPDKAVVLGTVPYLMSDGTIRNRAPILCGGRALFQDKLILTPWEDAFSGGDTIHIWQFKRAKFAVLVCLDIEVPELAGLLRGRGVDAILVPSATESVMGLERIGRCASARSVELCCYVGVTHLTGSARSELVDKNVGRAAWFTPSQAAFGKEERTLTTQTVWSGYERQLGRINVRWLARSRSARMETNPALVSAGRAQNILVESIGIS